MRIGISLALSALVSQVVCAEVCPTASSGSTEDLTIDSGTTCEITSTKSVKQKVTNNGTLILKSEITFQNGGTYTITSDNGFGTILVKNSVTIDASSTATAQAEGVALTGDTTPSLSIESQDITIDKNKTLTLKAQTITLGGDGTSTGTGVGAEAGVIGLTEATTTDKHTKISGDSSILTSTSTNNVVLSTTTTLNTKDLILTNTRINGSELATLKNTKLELDGGFIISGTTLTLSADSNSSFNLKSNTNTISAGTNALNIQGTHTFSGEGTLDFVGSTITLGGNATAKDTANLTKLTLGTDSNSTDKTDPKLGFLGDSKVLFSNVESSGLTLQIVKSGSSGATLHNINTTFTGGTLQALDRSDKDQILVIENGNGDTSFAYGKIQIKGGENAPTTFLGSGIQIYGQSITINGDTNPNTLILKTIEDNGEITLSRRSSNGDIRDGDILITGSSTSKNLQLRGVKTTIGGNTTLQNLNIQTQSSDEGMVFVGGEGGVLTLSNVTITSGIDDEDNKNYQSLSFTSDSRSTIFLGQPQPSTPTITSVATSSVNTTIKASSLAFTNQDISLANAGGGGALNLYSYGASTLSSNGSGVGNFAFTDTSITNGSGATLNLYSSENAKVLAKGLTLDNITLTTYKINNAKTNEKNAIDLSTAGNDFTTQGSVKIDTAKFLYGDTQGIGMDITIIGGENGDGKLTLTSATEGDSFTFGGTLTIDNSLKTPSSSSSSSASSTSQIDITLGSTSQSGVQAQADSQNVKWHVNGGLTAIGNATGGTTTTLTAKSFTFGAGSVVSSINGTLSLNASDSGDIDLKQALTMLQGVSSAEATISKGVGNLSLGNVIATGKTKIENATFNNSNITIKALGSGADTLAVINSNEVSGISSVDLSDSNLAISSDSNSIQPFLIIHQPRYGNPQDLKFNDKATITSNGTSSIVAKTIKAGSDNNGKISVNVQSGTLTYVETGTATGTTREATSGDAIGSVTLGLKDKQGGNLALMQSDSTYNSLKAPNITSYNDSTITAKDFNFNDSGATLSATDGELKLIAMDSTNAETLTIKQGSLTLDNASLGYYKGNGTQTLGKMTLHNGDTSVAITSTGTSSIQASELSLKGNTITSSEGVLTLQGVKADSTLGAVTIGNFGGITIAPNSTNGSKTTEEVFGKITLTDTLTLTANAPYTSSASPLGGGKFGVLQAQSVAFTQNGGADTPLIQIKVLDKPLVGEELFTLQEGGQVVVWTTNGITKGSDTTTGKTGNQAITLDDISLDSGGYKSLSLSAELVPNTEKTQVNAIKVLLSVAQSNASELTESISDNSSKSQMQTLLTQGDNQTIINSILSSPTNPLKVGFAENIAQGNVVVVGNALNYIDDTFTSLSQTLHLNDRIQTQITLSQASLIEGRFARNNNPHQTSSELAKFIRSYHNTHYASSDDELPSEEDSTPSGSGSLWVSYNGGLATGNSSNSTINGASAGYDHSIGSQALLGGFVSYAYGIFDGTFLHNTSHNVSVGLYSRAYFGSNEIDLTLSQNVALITSEIDVGNTTMPSLLNGAMQYNLYRTSLNARYGYTFKVGDEESPYYLKPLVGLNLSYTYQEGAETDAVASVGMNALSLFKMDLSVGMEMRKYINEGTYFFLMPLVERDLYGNSCEVDVGFIDSPNLRYTLDYQSQTSIAIYGGGEGNLTENLALNGSLGLKVGIEKSEVLTSWSVGLKYKF